MPRLADRGGAIFEPWLERQTDLSVSFHLAEPPTASAPTLLGSLEMLVTASGLHRGHCGEVDSRGRVFSGHALDETLRADAAAVAGRAAEAGFWGPCGIDAFTYLDSDRDPDRPRLRGLVEFNARTTMGLVTIGLVRRALPRVRDALGLEPGNRRAFLLTSIPAKARDAQAAFVAACGPNAQALALGSAVTEQEACPWLVFGPEKDALRTAHSEIFGC